MRTKLDGAEARSREAGSQVLNPVDQAVERAEAANSAELSRGGAGERPGRHVGGGGGEMLVSEDPIGEACCPSWPPTSWPAPEASGAGRGGGDSGGSSPGPQRAGREGGRVLGVRPPTIPTAMGPASHSHHPSIGRG